MAGVDRASEKGAAGDRPDLLLWHPAFISGGGCETPLSLANLQDECALVRALEGALAALAALEGAEWAGLPAFSAWSLDKEGLPRLRWDLEEATHPLAEHLQGFLSLFGARPGKQDGQPVLSRKHPHAAVLGRWFGRHAWQGSDARGALLDLHEALRCEGVSEALPALWGFYGSWQPRSGLGGPGFRAFRPCGVAEQSALALWCARQGVRRVVGREVSPYPFASLEPLVRACLAGSAEAPGAWLAARLTSPQVLSKELGSLLASFPSGWWLDMPFPVDAASLEVLGLFGEGLPGPLLIPTGSAEPAGEFKALGVLTMPPAAENWFLGEALEVCGSYGAVLDAHSGGGAPLPVPGSSLLPPVPEGRSHPEPPSRSPDSGPRGARLWRYSAGLEEKGDADAALWRCRAHLATGQAHLALEALGGAAAQGENRGQRALLEARALDRVQNMRGMRAALAKAGPLSDLPAETASEIRMLRGQSAWLAGEVNSGIEMLEEAIRLAEQPDSEVLATVALATAYLHQGRTGEAARLMVSAKRLLPKCSQARSKVLWELRNGLLLRKKGRYSEAAAAFDLAAAYASDACDHWNESVAHLEAGSALRLQFRFPEARARLRRAEEGFWALGLCGLRESARFDRMLCEVESGHLLQAQEALEDSLVRAAPSRDKIVERYWLARIFCLRGEPGKGIEQVRAALEEAVRFPDPEVEAPLHVLCGRLLLDAREMRRLGPALADVQRVFQTGADPDDRMEAAALLLEASSLPRSPYAPPGPPSLLEEIHGSASLASQGRWALAQGRAAVGDPVEAFLEARALALRSHDLSLEAEALRELFQRGRLPALPNEESWRVAAYLTENRIRGPLRELLPALSHQKPEPEPGGIALDAEPRYPVRLLESARKGGARIDEIGSAAGALCGVLLRPGLPAEWWGSANAALRKEMGELAGTESEIAWKGHLFAGAVGRGGLRACLVWGGEVAPQGAAEFFRAWAALLPVSGPPLPTAVSSLEQDPVFGRLLLGDSPALALLRNKLRSAAPFSFPVLLTGEPGVGKEACAHALHELSGGGRRPWVAANCANLSPTLAASLLFGHRKGAFTGADRDNPGLVEAAKGGTLFLDEVGELPPETQAQLLRFLQDGSYNPVGENRTRMAEARVVAATNRDLEQSVARGSFRADLFHRLNVIRVEIPPLRQRGEDIPLLFRHFLETAAAGEGRPIPPVEDCVWGRLAAYSWPGNVRELQNLARACLVAASVRGKVAEVDLPRPLLIAGGGGASRRLKEVRDEAERPLLAQALQCNGGNVSAAARQLGLSRQALANKLKSLGLAPAQKKGT